MKLYTEKYFKDNNSKWLVFIHGIGGSSKMWIKQVKFFKDKYNLLLIDLPGHGNSKEGIVGKGYKNFEDIADIIVETLKEEGIEKATFISVSMGTMIVGGILSKYPDMVEKAILSDVILNLNIVYKIILKLINQVKWLFSQKFILDVGSKILIPFKKYKIARIFYIKNGMSLERNEFMAWLTLVLKNLDVLKDLKKYQDNVLVVMGNKDYALINGVKKYFKRLKEKRLKVLEDCGHICCMLKWREFNDICLNYISAVI